jgi:NAD+ synthase (glutamine-hydrolysing)
MTRTEKMLRIGLAQMNTTVGDVEGNKARILDVLAEGDAAGAQIVATPELALTGYPPEDLLLKPSFVAHNRAALDDIARRTEDVALIVGFTDADKAGRLYNAAAVCHRGKVAAVIRKQLLPNYGVFDERRYFTPGNELMVFDTPEGVIGICVCEDVWFDPGPAIGLGDVGADLIININASPFHKAKLGERAAMLRQRARRAEATLVYLNAVGGQDELVFDGGSMVVQRNGDLLARWPQFEEVLGVVDVPFAPATKAERERTRRVSLPLRPAQDRDLEVPPSVTGELGLAEEIYIALELALRDYVFKNGFDKIIVGLSGGIDSALTATIAVDALGPDRVLTVAMPSQYSSTHSIQDAKELAAALSVELMEIPIEVAYRGYETILDQTFGAVETGLAEENLQARIRGNLLMFVSNRYGHLVVATGNKSEMACGYSTLYGDMAGGFALLKDVFKTEVYELALMRNKRSPVIPESILNKPPSAELRHDQKDSDSLPPYDVLDPILEAYIERDEAVEDIAGDVDPSTVAEVVALVDRAEYKRRQAPPGPKVTTKAFGRDRRLPITNKWREVP